jgi:hypothetical protein
MIEIGDKDYDIKDKNKNSVSISPEEVNWVDFWYERMKDNSDFISSLNNQYEWDKSLTWILAHNEQIQSLLSDILSSYWNYIKQDETLLRRLIEKKKSLEKNGNNAEQWEIVELFEEYLLNNDSQEWFEQFLLSNWCIRDIILWYFQSHTLNWKLNANLISKNNIKAKIKAERYKKLYMNYNEKYNLELNDRLINMVNFWESIKGTVDEIISNYLNKSIWEKEFLSSLEWLIWKGKSNETIKKIIESDPSAMDKFNFLLKNSIKEYSRLLDIWNENRTLQKTGDNVFDTQLRTYLFLYWKIFYPDIFISNWWTLDTHEWELWKILEAILVADWKLEKTKNNDINNKYINVEENFQNEITGRDRKMRKRARRPMNKYHPANKKEEILPNNIENKNLDIQNASWVEIAQEMELGKSLTGFKMKEIQSNVDIIFRKKITFKKTCIDFLDKNWENFHKFGLRISNLIYLNNDYDLSINYDKLNALKDKLNNSELNEIKNLVNVFIVEFNNNLKETEQKIDNKKELTHNVVKEYAIWAVIDNIKDMFQSIVKNSNEWVYMSWFEFDEKKSARIENNNLIISGKFNWETLILKYNLNNGELYMNSYISKLGNDTIVVWDNSPKQKIWELKPFQSVLHDFYENPTESMSNEVFQKFKRNPSYQTESKQGSNNTRPRHSPRRGIEARRRIKEEHKRKFQQICGTKLDEINERIKNQAKSRTTQNNTVSNLLKTLNIMPEDDDYSKTINLKENSDLYQTVKTITNSENDDINYFSNYLWNLMNKYIWLRWWKNNLLWQDKTTKDAKQIFNENKSWKTITYLRETTGNFNDEYSQIGGKLEFNSWSYFWILKLINEKFVDGEPSERRLNKGKMEEFYNDFSADLKYSEQQERVNKANEIAEHNNKNRENPDFFLKINEGLRT